MRAAPAVSLMDMSILRNSGSWQSKSASSWLGNKLNVLLKKIGRSYIMSWLLQYSAKMDCIWHPMRMRVLRITLKRTDGKVWGQHFWAESNVWSGCCRMAIIYGHICTEWDLTDWSMSGSWVVSPAQQTWITAARGQTGKWNEFPVTGLWCLFRTNNYGYFTVFPVLCFTSSVAYRCFAGFHLLLIKPTQLSLLHSKNIVTQCAAEDQSTSRRKQQREPKTKKKKQSLSLEWVLTHQCWTDLFLN